MRLQQKSKDKNENDNGKENEYGSDAWLPGTTARQKGKKSGPSTFRLPPKPPPHRWLLYASGEKQT